MKVAAENFEIAAGVVVDHIEAADYKPEVRSWDGSFGQTRELVVEDAASAAVGVVETDRAAEDVVHSATVLNSRLLDQALEALCMVQNSAVH